MNSSFLPDARMQHRRMNSIYLKSHRERKQFEQTMKREGSVDLLPKVVELGKLFSDKNSQESGCDGIHNCSHGLRNMPAIRS